MVGIIFDIKRFAVHDGPGIRTTVFLKGCPLQCRWCHNPESHRAVPEKVRKVRMLDGSEFAEDETIGQEMTVGEVISLIDKERIIMEESRGGVTFSGGEPLLQPLFLEELLKACSYAGYHAAIDTSGYASRGDFKRILPYTGLFLYDLKLMDDGLHRRYTGVPNYLILENFRWLVSQGKPVRVRFPVIRGITASKDNLDRLREFLHPYAGSVEQIDLLPYHRTGMNKYRRLGLPCGMPGQEARPEKEEMEELCRFFEADGHKVKTGG